MLFNYTCIVDSTWKHMIIEALKFEACTEAKLAWGSLLGVGFLLRQRCFTSLFPSPVIRASSHRICFAKVWAPRALQQWQGHSQCRWTAQGTNLETVSAKAEGELLGLDICQIKKKKKVSCQLTLGTLGTHNQNSANSKHPVFTVFFSTERVKFGLFHKQLVCVISKHQRSQRGALIIAARAPKCSPGHPHKNLPRTSHAPTQSAKKIPHISAQLSCTK